MLYKTLHNHSLFEAENGRLYRKHSDAFSVDILSGNDAIFGVFDKVAPVKPKEASERYPKLAQYLGER